MTISTTSDVPHQDLGAIEAAVKETARGRAFLASYARRVRQSDTLTMLAMLGRLERLSEELTTRIAELETAGSPRLTQAMAHGADLIAQSPALTTGDHMIGDTMHRIDELASVLGNLHGHAARIASQCPGSDGPGGVGSSVETDTCAFTPSDPPLLSAQSANSQQTEDEDVLDEIAKALAS